MAFDFYGQVPSAELTSIEDHFLLQDGSVEHIEGVYQDRLHRFYADVMGLFMDTQSRAELEQDGSWQVYTCVEEEDGPVLMLPRKDILVMARSRNVGIDKYSMYVRMMVNEAFTYDSGIDYLVTDVSIDHDGDSQYYIGSYPMREDAGWESNAPVFFTSEGRLCLGNYNADSYVAQSPVVECEGRPSTTIPFGDFEDITDAMFALEVANGILAQIKGRVPDKTSLDIER